VSEQGRIITFYSYKGGTGRTMLLANVAWILASAGQRVLVIDWDLEAPGLHRYFHPFLIDPELVATDGLIDMVMDYSRHALTPLEDEHDADWVDQLLDVRRYVVSVDWLFAAPGLLHLLPAGRQNALYAVRTNTFGWQDFYERLNGGAFFDLLRRKVRQSYDYVLIDSRTGVSDTSGICTIQMPDQLVVCFTASEQNLQGGAAIAASVKAHWAKRDSDGKPDHRIFPVFTRIEHSEKRKLDAARARARLLFRPLLNQWHSDEEAYWNRIEISYWPYYAFEEVLAVFGDEFRTETSLIAACETITDLITDGQIKRAILPDPVERESVLRKFARGVDSGFPADIAEQSREADTLVISPKDGPQYVRVFLSAAEDVADERALARRLLTGELPYDPLLRGNVSFDVISWDTSGESAPFASNLGPQNAVARFGAKPSDCDIVIFIVWSRIGSALDVSDLRKPNGELYLSALEWAFEDAFNARPQPTILIYRRSEEPKASLRDVNLKERLRELELIDKFVNTLSNPDRCYTIYTTATELRDRLAVDLKQILHDKIRSGIRDRPAGALWSESPYPGMRPFWSNEARIFFGRGREVDAITDRLRDPTNRFIAVIGPSGVGKSSLIRAGLIPRLEDDEIEGSRYWRVLSFSPGEAGDNPFMALASEIARTLPAQDHNLGEISTQLLNGRRRLSEYTDALLTGRLPGSALVLFIDQFDELFTLVSLEYRRAFAEFVAQAASDPQVRLLVTIRSDFIAQCLAEPALTTLLQRPAGIFLLGPPGPAALIDMIRLPAERAGLEVEDGLADEILRDAGVDPGVLPLVAFCLEALYLSRGDENRLTLASYHATGGLHGAFSRRAEEVVASIRTQEGEEIDSALPELFHALVR
jgi:hypothetical protein